MEEHIIRILTIGFKGFHCLKDFSFSFYLSSECGNFSTASSSMSRTKSCIIKPSFKAP